MASKPIIYVLAGVNGSGKSSIGGAALTSRKVDYFNPDSAASELRRSHPGMTQEMANSLAWKLGKELLQKAIEKKQTYAFETTLGGSTITRLLIKASEGGFRVIIWYVGLKSVDLHIARVRARVAHGGHDIPTDKIRERWCTSRRNLIRLLPHLYGLRLFDNSHHADPVEGYPPQPQLLLHLEADEVVGPSSLTGAPDWAKPIIAGALQLSR